jgi:hypothetical protein
MGLFRLLSRVAFVALILCGSVFGMARTSGYCQQGGQVVVTSTVPSTTKVQQSYPQCVITVFVSGTLTHATLYSDNGITPLSNPFTASKTGYWGYYAPDGIYDVSLSGGGIPAPFTWGAITSTSGCPANSTCDVNYLTITAACTAAGNGTLYVTKPWASLTTQVFNCQMVFLATGRLQPASGQTVTFDAALAGLSTICDISAGGSCVILAPGGIQYPEWRGARADGSTDSGAAILATRSQIPCGVVRYSPGIYQTSVYLVKDMTTGDDCDDEGVLGNGGSPGTVIQWTGAQYGRIVGLQGASQDFQARVHGIAFDCNNLASTGLWVDQTRSPEIDQNFFENCIPDTMNSTASLNTGTSIFAGTIAHNFFFASSQRAIGLNLAGSNGGPNGWRVENNYFQQVQNEVLGAVNAPHITFTNNIIDGLLANTGQKGVRVDAACSFVSENNYFESIYGIVFNVNPTLNCLQGGSPVGQTARFSADAIVNSGHAGTPNLSIANAQNVDIRGETTITHAPGSPAFVSIAATALRTIISASNDLYGLPTVRGNPLVADSSGSTIYTDQQTCQTSSTNVPGTATPTTIITVPSSATTVDIRAVDGTDGYVAVSVFNTGLSSTTDLHSSSDFVLSYDGAGNIKATVTAGSTRTISFNYCYDQ